MEIDLIKQGKNLTISLEGRLDNNTASELEEKIENLKRIKDLTLDLDGLDYISSAGLRVLLTMQKLMNSKDGKMTITNVSENVMGIFEVTGFSEILNIEED